MTIWNDELTLEELIREIENEPNVKQTSVSEKADGDRVRISATLDTDSFRFQESNLHSISETLQALRDVDAKMLIQSTQDGKLKLSLETDDEGYRDTS